MTASIARNYWPGLAGLVVCLGILAPMVPARAAVLGPDWDTAYNSGNVRKLADIYEENAVSMAPGAPSLVGRAAIVADFRNFFRSNTSVHHAINPVRIVSGDILIERARYEMTTVPRNGAKPSTEKGKHIVVWHRGADRRWRVMWEIWNTD